ncbi:MAG: dipeptidase [Promethearchaeota archaeon]
METEPNRRNDINIDIQETIDGHVDFLCASGRDGRKFNECSGTGHVNLQEMKNGRFLAALFAIFPAYTPGDLQLGIDRWKELVQDEANELFHVKKVEDFKSSRDRGKIGAILHVEGAGGITGDPFTLQGLYERGLRTLGITHNKDNLFGTCVKTGARGGLTEKGVNLVIEAQELGITIDVSHLSDASFWDVFDASSKPFFASHSNARKICPHPRNLTDEQVAAISEKKGTIGLNFGSGFIDPEMNPKAELDLKAFKRHVDHISDTGSINVLAIGSDYDGTFISDCVGKASKITRLYEYLLVNGYSKCDIAKISHENLLRLFKKTWN